MTKYIVIVGGQYGDEGKGRVIDDVAPYADVIVRFSGADNAGHTVIVGKEKYVFHSLPSGILREHCINVNGPGFFTNIMHAPDELSDILSKGFNPKLAWDMRSQVIMPWHPYFDKGKEAIRRKSGNIGTTGRGVGPAAESKADRVTAFNLADLLGSEEQIYERIYQAVSDPELLLKLAAYHPEFEFFKRNNSFDWIINLRKDSTLDIALQNYASDIAKIVYQKMRVLDPYLEENVSILINDSANKLVLFEGAQGTMLDTTFGIKPFVTSTPTMAYGACLAGIGPSKITDVVGVFKAYVTRVGGGTLDTEINDNPKLRRYIIERGKEYGATTDRERRPGWFDLPEAVEAVRLNGMNGIIVTKLDVLDELQEIKIGVAKSAEGVECRTFRGWQEDSSQCMTWDDIFSSGANQNRRAYLQKLEKGLSVPILGVCVGYKRGQFILEPSFEKYLEQNGIMQ